MKEVLISWAHNNTSQHNPRICSEGVCSGMERVSEQVPPWWACAWVKERTPGLRRRSSRCIVSATRRKGWRGGASAPVTPARPPPECPGAHSRSWSKPPTSDALVKGTRRITAVSRENIRRERDYFPEEANIPSRPSLDFGESAGRQWASWGDGGGGQRWS